MNVTTLRPYYPTCSCFEKTKDLLLSMVKSRPICGQLWWESSEAESFLVLKTIWALTRSLTLISLVKSRSICSAVVRFLVLKTIHVAQCWQGAISFAENLPNLCLKWRKAPTLKSHTELNTQQLSKIYSNQCERHTVSQIRTLCIESTSFNNYQQLTLDDRQRKVQKTVLCDEQQVNIWTLIHNVHNVSWICRFGFLVNFRWFKAN